ncbi:MAG: hypothetical protein CME61_06360 [Halobacteriovoraceae bacterium]|nr:hypothetical protein [Halobacteriovoraceae bacterium]|tara:strand:- start:903 stop:1484 length:582 start_codon:yes stop_codon:yes gene_type:complete
MKYLIAPEKKETYFLGEFIAFKEVNNIKLSLVPNTFLNEQVYVADANENSVTLIFLSPLKSPTIKTRKGETISLSSNIMFEDEVVEKKIDFLELSKENSVLEWILVPVFVLVMIFFFKGRIRKFVYKINQNRKIKKIILNGDFKNLIKENSFPKNQAGFLKLKNIIKLEIYKKEWPSFRKNKLPKLIREYLNV